MAETEEPRELERGRAAHEREQWSAATTALDAADRDAPLAAEDLERLATSEYMLGREGAYLGTMERAYHAHLAEDRPLAAVRCAFWISVNETGQGRVGPGGGWLGRAQRLLDEAENDDLVERGYLLIPTVFEHEMEGELEAAELAAAEAAAIGKRCDDPDLFSLAAHEQGHILIRSGRVKAGVRLLDEVMVAVAAGELSPVVSGIVYCGVILACQDARDIRRAQEWTAALTGWCERQPDLVAFTGRCLVHRAELMQLHGAWSDALEEARRAGERSEQAENPGAAGDAHYRRGEILRLLGEFDQAESAYKEASHRGREPLPGLAMLRLAQGRAEIAWATLKRALSEVTEPARRVDLLAGAVEVALARGLVAEARVACDELGSITRDSGSAALEAIAACSLGAVEIAEGRAGVALTVLRGAEKLWTKLDAPHEVARARELIGIACQELDDSEAAGLEFEAAGSRYQELGAAPDLERMQGIIGRYSATLGGLTARELEVLRHVAAGETNRAIADELVLSERTIDRHVSNIFAKLGVSSRAAATAQAYERRLL